MGWVEDLKQVAVKMVAPRAAKIVFLALVKPYTPEQVNQAINEKKNLWGGFSERMQYLEDGIQYSQYILENIDQITPQLILTYMAESGEPWYSQAQIIINTPGGIQWFMEQVNFIKSEIIRYYSEVDRSNGDAL
jgi:hypothetical protein